MSSSAPKISAEIDKLITYAVQHPDQFKIIADQFASRSRTHLDQRKSEEGIERLRAQYELFSTHETFGSGQLVQWKPGLKNKSKPGYGEPAIVVEVLLVPILNTKEDASSTYFREPLDLILGVMDDDDEMILYYFDSRRFSAFDATK